MKFSFWGAFCTMSMRLHVSMSHFPSYKLLCYISRPMWHWMLDDFLRDEENTWANRDVENCNDMVFMQISEMPQRYDHPRSGETRHLISVISVDSYYCVHVCEKKKTSTRLGILLYLWFCLPLTYAGMYCVSLSHVNDMFWTRIIYIHFHDCIFSTVIERCSSTVLQISKLFKLFFFMYSSYRYQSNTNHTTVR